MEEIVLTPRLKLTLVKTLERGSQDLDWVHIVRSDPLATQWSLLGASKTLEDAQRIMRNGLSAKDATEEDKKKYRVRYIIHKRVFKNPGDERKADEGFAEKTEVIGILSWSRYQTIPLTDDFSVPDGPDTGILKVEIGYMFLPTAWNKGYASEALTGALAALQRSTAYWAPFKKVYVEAVAGATNPASTRVMEKAGMRKVGLFEWEGEKVFLGGAWQEPKVFVYAIWLVGTA